MENRSAQGLGSGAKGNIQGLGFLGFRGLGF